jgi:hypothetical protein
VEAQDGSFVPAMHSIRMALEKAEAANPGLTHELVDAILDIEQMKGGVDSTEKLLRAAAQDIEEYRVSEMVCRVRAAPFNKDQCVWCCFIGRRRS